MLDVRDLPTRAPNRTVHTPVDELWKGEDGVVHRMWTTWGQRNSHFHFLQVRAEKSAFTGVENIRFGVSRPFLRSGVSALSFGERDVRGSPFAPLPTGVIHRLYTDDEEPRAACAGLLVNPKVRQPRRSG